jgi:4-hydroxy-2-oxoheptanedioate aldolase
MDMRPSNVLRKLRNGEIVSCFKINLADTRVAALASICGFDCIWADMEHVPNGIEAIESLVFATKAYNTDILVRIERGAYNDYIKPLEADATGIMVPHLMSIDDAKQIVRMTRFHPIGLRPVDGGNNDACYCMVSGKDYFEQANRERFVIVQVEDKEVLPDLDAICEIDGIDMIFFGPADFSQSIGTPHDPSNPYIEQVRQLVADTARKHGKFAGTVGSIENLEHLVGMGYQFINLGADVLGLRDYCEMLAGSFKRSIDR